MASVSHEEVKVVLIDTHYFVTDPMSFKSVVQSLTGKESCVAWTEESSLSGEEKKRTYNFSSGSNGGGVPGNSSLDIGSTGGGCGGDCCLSKSMSVKDLDGILLELPPMEWQQLWAQHNL